MSWQKLVVDEERPLHNVWRQDRDEVMMSDKIDGVVAHFIAHNKVGPVSAVSALKLC